MRGKCSYDAREAECVCGTGEEESTAVPTDDGIFINEESRTNIDNLEMQEEGYFMLIGNTSV